MWRPDRSWRVVPPAPRAPAQVLQQGDGWCQDAATAEARAPGPGRLACSTPPAPRALPVSGRRPFESVEAFVRTGSVRRLPSLTPLLEQHSSAGPGMKVCPLRVLPVWRRDPAGKTLTNGYHLIIEGKG